ncbi:MAG: PA2928 family protein [Ferruginibacter sp.]
MLSQKTTRVRFFILLLGGALVLLLNGCLQKFNNYGVKDLPAVSADGKLLVLLVAENAATSYSQNGGYRKTTYHTSYWLKQYDVAAGKLNKKKKLFSAGELSNAGIEVCGTDGSFIWLYTDMLRVYDIASLEEVNNQDRIAASNGKSNTVFPADSRLIKPFISRGYIDFTSGNGEEYRLTLADMKIVEKDAIHENGEDEEVNIRRLLHEDDYGSRCDAINGRMYIFAKDSAAAKNISPPYDDLGEAAYRMKLFSTPFAVKKLGLHNSYTYGRIEKTGEASYLNPCFVKDNYEDRVIHLENPAGYLLLHQDVLGSNAKVLVTRIDTANKKIWESVTGVSTKISGCISRGNYCIITTNRDYMLSPFIGKDAVCIINITDGRVINLSLDE